MPPWLGKKRVAFVPFSRPSFDPPGSPQGDNWKQQIWSRIYFWPDALRGVDVSLRNYIQTISQGRADIEGEVKNVYAFDQRDVPPDFLASQFEQLYRDQGFDAAALVMNGGPNTGQGSAPGFWARFAMVEGVGVWMMELTHVLCWYMDLYTFVTGTDGGIYTAYWDANGWSSFSRIDPGFATTAGTSVAAIARYPDHLDLFVTGTDGGIYTAYWDANGWSSFSRIDPGFATTAGTSVAAIARYPDHLDLFVTGTDGGIYTAYWDANGWSSFSRIDPGFATTAGTSVAAIARYPDHLDLFVTGTDGGIYSDYWGASGWSSFFRIDPGFATTAGTSVAAIARTPDHLDLFVRGTDDGIHSVYRD